MNEQTRPAIPAEIRRRVLVGSGHRCAIPTCRHIDVDIPHIEPWENCRTHEYQNLIALCPNCHRRANQGQIDKKALRVYKANLRFIHDRFSQFEVDMLFECYNLKKKGKRALWPPYLMLLIKRLLDADFLERTRTASGRIRIGGLESTPDLLVITTKGQQFIDDLGIDQDNP